MTDINTNLLYALLGSQNPMTMMQPQQQQVPQQIPPPGIATQQPTDRFGNALTALMGNPMFGAGMGLLSSAQGGNPWQGALAGMYGSQLFKQRQQQFDLEAQQAKAERERLKNITMLAQEGLKTIDVDGDGNISPAEQARAEYLKGAATTGDAALLSKANETLASLQPKQQGDTTRYRDLVAAGLIPGTPEFQDAMMSSVMRPNVQINNQERIPPPPTGHSYIDPSRPELGVVPMKGGPADPKNPANWTEAERASAGYHQRMVTSGAQLGRIASPTIEDFTRTFGTKGTIQNLLSTPQYREYIDYATDWIRAKLRKESGATIPPAEWEDEYRTYFWEPGDTEVDSRRKMALRLAAERQLAMSAGRAVTTAESRDKELQEQGFSADERADILINEGWVR